MYTGILHTHNLVVTLFLLLYLVKTALLLFNKRETLQSFIQKTKIPEMIISTLFLLTGIFLALKTGNKGEWLWVKIACIAIVIPLAIVAFKKSNKVLALLSFLILVYIYGISETKSPNFKKEHANGFNIGSGIDASELGKNIFDTECANCHGSDGKLGLSGAKDLTQSTLSHDEKITVLSSGKNTMKAYKDVLSIEQMEAVVNYIEQLK